MTTIEISKEDMETMIIELSSGKMSPISARIIDGVHHVFYDDDNVVIQVKDEE